MIEESDSIERKKWLVGRIDEHLTAVIEEKERHQETFLEESKNIIEKHRELEKIMFAIMGIVATVIIGTIGSENLEGVNLIGIIIIIFSGSIIIVFIIHEIRLKKPIENVKSAYHVQLEIIGSVKEKFLVKSFDIEKYTSKQLETYAKFFEIVAGTSEIKILETHEKLLKKIGIDNTFEKYIKIRLGTIRHNIETTKEEYNVAKNELEGETMLDLMIHLLDPIKKISIQKK